MPGKGNGGGERWFSARELAGLPGMPESRDEVTRCASRESWSSRLRQSTGRGRNGREYPLSCLPPETQRAILARLVDEASSKLPALIPEVMPPSKPESLLPAAATPRTPVMVAKNVRLKPASVSAPESSGPEGLKDWQRRVRDSRLAILNLVDQVTLSVGSTAAIRHVVEMASRYELSPEIQSVIPHANARSGKTGARTLSESTIFRWRRELKKGILAPRPVEKRHIPDWIPPLVLLYARPQKPSLSSAIEKLPQHLPQDVAAPDYHQVRRYLKKVSALDILRGRHGPRKLRDFRMHMVRDFSQVRPMDIVSMDGHKADFYMAHPSHGQPVRPEFTTIVCIGTRKGVGLSVRLTESGYAVADALAHMARTHGIPGILYVDNGSGYKNDMMNNEICGLLARLGITMKNSIPYNSQARGVIEALNKNLWVRAAKELPSYCGRDMDKQAATLALKIAHGKVPGKDPSSVLMTMEQVLAWGLHQLDLYNAHPHSSLPSFRDPKTGRIRKMSPNDMEAWWRGEGYEPLLLTPEEEKDLFRPYEERTAKRGTVEINSHTYFGKDLEHYHGARVLVGFDQRDLSRVWVRDMEGRFICEARFNATKQPYFAQTQIQQANERRVLAAIKRKEKAIGLHKQELVGTPNTVDAEFSDDLTPEEKARADEKLKALSAPPPEEDDPVSDEIRFWRWANSHRDEISEEQKRYLDDRIERSAAFRELLGLDEDGGFSVAPGFCSLAP